MEKVIAKKKFGQNFLKDNTVLQKIIEAMPKNDNKVVEIGPGLGDLTKELVKYKEVIAYEVDADLIGLLKEKFDKEIQNSKLTINFGDVLEFWEKNKTLYGEGKYDLIANLPYYIATNIILKAFDDINCENIMVMVQKEVADKFIAEVGDREFSALGVLTNTISTQSKIVVVVPPESFEPAPKVDSAVIYIKKNLSVSLEKRFKDFLKSAFASPRKKLSKNLTAVVSKAGLDSIYKELDIKDDIRPHELSASLYRQIYEKVIKNGNELRN
ncbi:MAG: 16S rRNA (adenine(1518)-N(6)/adenine(1519)-N(6))-dimethyltransferase RsmA [Arcobacteraceae bacterium]